MTCCLKWSRLALLNRSACQPTNAAVLFLRPRGYCQRPEPPAIPDEETINAAMRKVEISNRALPGFVTYDPKNILQEPEDEQKQFQEYQELYGPHMFVKPRREVPADREFLVVKDAEVWAFVERLLPPEKVPSLPRQLADSSMSPSGFRPPRVVPGTFPYHVSRPKSHMLPVYSRLCRNQMTLTTSIKRVDGNLFKLKEELDAFLMERYRMEFIAQVAEVRGKIVYRGDFEEDFKEFLLEKGF